MRKIIAIAAAILTLASCSHKDVQIVSMNIDNFSAHGFKSADVSVSLEIENPRSTFTVSNMNATVLKRGEEFGEITSPSVVKVPGHKTSTVSVDLSGRITGSISLGDILFLSQNRDFSQFTVNYSATLRDCLGFKHKVSGDGLPIQDFLSQLDL